MRSPTDFLVKAVDGKRYANTKNIGGIDVIISTSDEDHTVSQRMAEVIAIPLYYNGPVKEGDTLLVHHNVFKFYNDVHGVQRSGKSYFKDDLFLIDDMQYYMYYNGEEWNAVGRYNFIEPFAPLDSFLHKAIEEEPLQGIMRYPSAKMKALGIKEGDVMVYVPMLAAEYKVNDIKMYRLYDDHLTVVL